MKVKRYWYVYKHPRRRKLKNVFITAESEGEALKNAPIVLEKGERLYGFIGIAT
jgi:hypothetical protein